MFARGLEQEQGSVAAAPGRESDLRPQEVDPRALAHAVRVGAGDVQERERVL